MNQTLLLLVTSSLLATAAGCKREATPDSVPAAKPVASAPAVSAPAPTAPATPAAAAFDVLALAQGTLAAFDATNHELVLVVEERGPTDAVKVTRFAMAQSGEAASNGRELGAPVGAAAAIAKTYGTAITAALQGLQPLAGVGFTNQHASPSQGIEIEYVPASADLRLTSAGQTWIQHIDGGGVATPQPIAAFALPASHSVAVFMMLVGDEVRESSVRVFDLDVSPEDTAMEAAAEARLQADAECPSGDRHDCHGTKSK